MSTDELLDLFRKDIEDTVRPYLWSDDELYAYMNDAYYMFVRLTGGISDFTSAACSVTTTANQEYSSIHPSILVIRQATYATTNNPIRIINAQDVDSLTGEDYGILQQLAANQPKGKPKYMIIGMQPDYVQWASIPDAAYTVKLLIERLPLAPITGPGESFDGVKDHHHLHFMKWMRSLAYNKQDAETADKQKAAAAAAEFAAYCELAKREKERYKHKVRVVRYGGI